MKKGVVILIIIGSLCYFGIRWYSRKHTEDSSISRFASIRQWASTRDTSESEIIYEKDIILETSSGKSETRNPKPEIQNPKSDKEKKAMSNELLVAHRSPLIAHCSTYVVKPGDTLIKIAKQYNTSYELIMRLNKKQNTLLKVNEQLKILKGKVALLVDKSDFALTVRLDGNYIKQYPIGTGVAGKTPVGTFTLKDKLKNPVWYSPEGVYEYGNPKNILGTRWLGFEDKPGLRGYGIHGTTLPDSIGKESSMGCIRMLNEDVEDLYGFVVPGTEVIIQE